MSAQSPSTLPFSGIIPPELEADTRAVLDALTGGKPLDTETRDRIRREADKVRDAIQEKHGNVDIGVPAIRELRDS
jgi:hypothetical protein